MHDSCHQHLSVRTCGACVCLARRAPKARLASILHRFLLIVVVAGAMQSAFGSTYRHHCDMQIVRAKLDDDIGMTGLRTLLIKSSVSIMSLQATNCSRVEYLELL